MAVAASCCPVEEGLACLRVAHQDVQHIVIRAGPQSVADLLVQKMRQVHDLFLRQHHWFSRWMALREIGSDRASVAVVKNHYGPHQVGGSPASACPGTMTGDALRDI